ncbi:hypothetical protein A2U01_0106628, partial [Trifolium medium]|nr:hypothetical protein [Trifolium medium]
MSKEGSEALKGRRLSPTIGRRNFLRKES